MPRTAKRKLTDIKFEKEGAHVALVSKQQNGPANGHDYALILKANRSEEFVQKMQQIQVTMELPDFLEKFFHLYGSDAEVLARMMGYVKPESESDESEESYEDWYENYIQEKLSQFTVLKALKDSDNLELSLAGLDEDTYLAVLQTQSELEGVMKKAEEGSTEAVAKAKVSDDKTNAKVEPSGETLSNGTQMEELELLKAALAQKDAELLKAQEALAAIEKAKQEAIIKSKTDKVADLVKNETHRDVIVKAALALETDAEFDGFVAALTELNKAAEKSELFEEQGAAATTETVEKSAESLVAKALKSQLKLQ